MSIYSGFATRFQEQAYDHCIDSLLYVLQKRIIRFYSGQPTDEEKFISVVLKLNQQMKKMEKNKYLDPKSSESVSQLAKFMQVYQHNIVQGSRPEPSIQPETVPIKIAEPKQPVEQSASERKKSSYWVQRIVKDQINKEQVNEDIRTKTKSKEREEEDLSKEKKIVEFRRTNYQQNPIRGVKLKQSSRSNLSRDRDSISGIKKLQKSRATSNYLRDKASIHGSNTLYNDPSQKQDAIKVMRKFQNVSNNPNQIKPAATRGEAEDIIKDYIVKMKHQKKTARNKHNRSQMMGRLHDF